MKSKILMLSTLLLLAVGTALGQTINVKGVVFDENGEPMIGATVRAKNDASNGAQTNFDGEFALPKAVKQGEIIIISSVGYKTQELPAAANMKVNMKADSELLDEVVVVAYGTVKKESMVGAQASVSAKELAKRPITNVTNALSAAAPGVQVITSSGAPGSSAGIRIRGFGSVNASSAPLFVVDGTVYGGNISDIPSSDIQSVSVLKDAASTSLYGSSAGNGVILITTKSGSRAAVGKPNFTLTTNVGFSRRGRDFYETVGAMDVYPLRWQQWYNNYKYNEGYNDEQAAYWANYDALQNLVYQPYSGIETNLIYDAASKSFVKGAPGQKGTTPLIVMPDGTLNPEINGLLWGDDMDWEKELFRTGLRQEYTLSGGLNTEKLKSYMSVSYLGEEGYKRFSHLNRFSARTTLSYDVTDWLCVGTNTSITRRATESPKSLRATSSNPFNFMTGIAPIYPIHEHNADGSYVLDGKGNKVYDYNPKRPYNGRFNPVYEQSIDKSTADTDAISNRSFARFNLYKGLTFTTNLGYDLLRSSSKVRYNNIMGDQPQGQLSIESNRYTTVTFNQLLEYDTDFNEAHHLNVLLGHESYNYETSYLSGRKENMFILGLDEMVNFSKISSVGSGSSQYRKEGYFSRVNYDYEDLYNVSFSYRYDGSSIFSPESRWGHFWSVGAGWNVSNEEFMANTRNWLSRLKLRASVGQTGNDAIGTYYAYQNLFSLGSNNLDQIGLRVANIGNPKLVWEKQTAYDLAIEFGLFNRVWGTFEFFNKESDDLLFSFPLPISTGVGSIDKNLGKVRNYGLEMELKFNVIQNRDFSWNIGWNGTIFRNKIVRLPEENRELGIEQGTKLWKEGKSIYDFYIYRFMGVDPEDGRAMYRMDEEKYPEQADPNNPKFAGLAKEGEKMLWTKDGRFVKKEFTGDSSIPSIYGGISTDLSYKNFDFSMQFAYQLGGKVYDAAYQGLMGRRLKSGNAIHKDMLNAWKKPNDITDVPRLDAEGTNYDNLTSDRFLISANSLMLKSVTLGYTLPKDWVSYLNLNSARVSIAGENLFLLSKRKGLNPMSGYAGVSSNIGYDYARIFSMNLSVTF